MTERLTADLCVIGAGSGGLSVAAGAAQLGLRTILLEKGQMGGDCLNYGCVPSKALLAAGHAARHPQAGAAFGVSPGTPDVDFAGVHRHVHEVIDAIAPNDSVARFSALGVRVIREAGCFTDARSLATASHDIRARRYVIATGSRPTVPPLPGLDQVTYLTNETLFDLKERPDHLIIIGGGPIGLEMAQAFRRLGARVTVLALAFMEQDDPELATVLLDRLRRDGVRLEGGIDITGIRQNDGRYDIRFARDGREEDVRGSHLLLATGRRAHLDGLGLAAAGIDHTPDGVTVGADLRSSNRRVYAVGDAAGGPQFTHKAGYDAGILIRRLAFGMFWARTDYRTLPRVTYTDPELAQVGLTEGAAREKYGAAFARRVRVLRWPYGENDRAQAERRTDGLIKVLATPRGHVLGAGIVGAGAGELIQVWALAMSQKLKISALAGMIAPYPTLGEISKRAAGSFYTPSLFSEKTRKLVRLLSKLG